MKYIFLIFSVLFFSCAHHELPEDPYGNHSEYNYHRAEFDFFDGINTKKEIGILNIYIPFGASLKDQIISIYGYYKGVIHLKDPSCGIDISTTYETLKKIALSDIMERPKKCAITVLINTDEIEGRQHLLVESGIIRTFTFEDKDIEPVEISYFQANHLDLVREYSFVGQGSMQRQEGYLSNQVIILSSDSKEGLFRIDGCGKVYEGSYKRQQHEIRLKDLFKKDFLEVKDSCEVQISLLPFDAAYSKRAAFFINIYGKEVIKLPTMSNRVTDGELIVTGPSYLLGCSINNTYSEGHVCTVKYEEDKVYWLRAVTKNGRKSIYALKNKKTIWSE